MILFSVFLLAGCESAKDSNIEYPSTIDSEENIENNDSNDDTPNSSVEEPEEQDAQPDDSSTEGEINSDQTTEQVEKDDTINDHLKGLDEYAVIADYIDLTTYTGTIQTDNKGNRIIIFANANGQKEYKSIYVKRANRLKIVTFDDDGLLFNDVLK